MGKIYGAADQWKATFQEMLRCNGEEGSKQADFLEIVSLSQRTVTRRISVISAYITDELKKIIYDCKYFSIAIDDSADITNIEKMMIFIKTIDDRFQINEGLLECASLYGTTKGTDIFGKLKSSFEKHSLTFAKLSALCTDGAPSMTSSKVGVVGQFKKIDANIKNIHCAIHQFTLCTKKIGLKETLQTLTKIANKIKGGHNALVHRQFKSFLEEFEAEYQDIALYTEVRWLSKGRFLSRLFSLRNEIQIFMETNDKFDELKGVFKDSDFLMSFAFLTDITDIFNAVNCELQGQNKNIFDIVSSLSMFKNKMLLLKTDIKGNLLHFKACRVISQQCGDKANFSKYEENIDNILADYNNRFKDFEDIQSIADIYFFALICPVADQPVHLQAELQNLQQDLQYNRYDTKKGIEFWSTVSTTTYPTLTDHILRICSMFRTTYCCESGFSVMKWLKNEHRYL